MSVIAGHGCSGLAGGIINTGACVIAMALAALSASPRTAAQDKTPPPVDGSSNLLPSLLAGFAECTSGPAYLRLSLDPSGGTGRLDFGPSIRSAFPRGAYGISAQVQPDGSLRIEPVRRIGRRVPQLKGEMKLQGRFDDGSQRYEGQVLDVEACSTFSLERQAIRFPDVNPDGLLFRAGRSRQPDLTAEDCRRYGNWLATEEMMEFDAKRITSLVHDHERMHRILGKTPRQLSQGDHMRLSSLGQSCQRMLRQSGSAEDRAMLERVRDWVPVPFGTAIDDPVSTNWLLAEQALLVRAKSRSAADEQLAEIAAAPPGIESLDIADRAIIAVERRRGWLDTLGRKGRDRHARALKVAREELEVRIAASLAGSFQTVERHYDAFAALEVLRARHAAALRRKRAYTGVQALNEAFAQRAAADAEALWPMLLAESDAVYDRLADAGYERYGELGRFRKRASTLGTFYQVHRSKLGAAHAEYVRRGRELAYRMAERSQEHLVRWVEALPPSEQTYRAIREFIAAAFGGQAVPDDLPALRDAIAAKRALNNPQGYRRPDIVLALLREQWPEVGRTGFETLAYYRTLALALDRACPRLVPKPPDPRGLAILAFYHRMLLEGAGRLFRGQVHSDAEASRAIFLTLNGVVNQPGCIRDRSGNAGRCSGQRERDAANDAVMTSREANQDAAILLQGGCSGDAARFVENLSRFSLDGLDDTPQPAAISAEDFVAGITR